MTVKRATLLTIMGIVSLTVIQFIVHRCIPFMMDDIWYGTNLVTGQKIQNLNDVIQSQIWHFHNWGGRSMTHGVLQLTLWSGELCADILNVLMTLLLAWMICVVAKQKNLLAFLMSYAMMIALNANWKMSMFWQAGAVNYVYATIWILVFIWPYLSLLEEANGKQFPLIGIWIVPMGILAGWSNENMGPACFLLTLGITLYHKVYQKKAVKLWMALGILCSLLGSVLVVVAPGNFVRSATIEKKGLFQTVFDRVYAMLGAGTDFLFPAVLLLVLVILIKCVCLGQALTKMQVVLLLLAILSYGAMILSPHYPDRATFGTMVVCITLFVSILYDIKEKVKACRPYMLFLTAAFWLYASSILLTELIYL